ncbi:unnamed protein product [Alternaria alternata]
MANLLGAFPAWQLHISLAVCKDFKGVKWSELDPKKKEDIFQEIKDAMRKSKLPAVDDQGIEWRVSSVLPSLRHMQRFERCPGSDKISREYFARRLMQNFEGSMRKEKTSAAGRRFPKKYDLNLLQKVTSDLFSLGFLRWMKRSCWKN